MRFPSWPVKKPLPPAKKAGPTTLKSLHTDIEGVKSEIAGIKSWLSLRFWGGVLVTAVVYFWPYIVPPDPANAKVTRAEVASIKTEIERELMAEIRKGFADLKAKPGRASIAKTSPAWAPFQK